MFRPLVFRDVGDLRPTLFVDEAAFAAWLSTARVGAELIYFFGHLADARESGYLNDIHRGLVVAVADFAMSRARSGHVMLYQRRNGLAFDYVARRLPARPR